MTVALDGLSLEAIPLVDLKAQYRSIADEIDDAIRGVVESTAFIGGEAVEAFEREFAAFGEVPHVVGVGSGTDALRLALQALGVGPGDDVVTSPLTFIATTEAVTQVGANPVFADVDPRTLALDPACAERAITARTKAVLPVHLYGQCADLAAFEGLARRKGLLLVEDACQAHGARFEGRRAGSVGHASAFSFYPGKNLGAFGEAGAVATRDAAVARTVATLRDHGQEKRYVHSIEGTNARLDGIQAAVLRVKLRRLERWNERRRALAARYRAGLSGTAGLDLLHDDPRGIPVPHLFTIHHDERDRLRSALADRGIGAGLHYPIPLHLQAAYRRLRHSRGDFPIAERAAARTLSLPLFPELPETTLDRVVATLRGLCGRNPMETRTGTD